MDIAVHIATRVGYTAPISQNIHFHIYVTISYNLMNTTRFGRLHQQCGAAMTLTIPFMTYTHSKYLDTTHKHQMKNITVQIHTCDRHFFHGHNIMQFTRKGRYIIKRFTWVSPKIHTFTRWPIYTPFTARNIHSQHSSINIVWDPSKTINSNINMHDTNSNLRFILTNNKILLSITQMIGHKLSLKDQWAQLSLL